MAPLVSIIIPVYNRSKLLERAVKSVQAQTFQSFEILIVDDHSTEDLKTLFPKYHIPTTGVGVSAARNTGIRSTRSPFVALLDSDDEWLPTKLEKQMDYLHHHPDHSMVHTEEIWMRGEAQVQPKKKHQKSGDQLFERSTELCIISPSTVLFRRELLDSVGLFDEGFPVCEDFDLWLRILSEHDIGFLEEPLVIKHGGHADQLSFQYHSMDLWRLRALVKQLNNPKLTPKQREAVKTNLHRKGQILLKGFEKYKNFEHQTEVESALLL